MHSYLQTKSKNSRKGIGLTYVSPTHRDGDAPCMGRRLMPPREGSGIPKAHECFCGLIRLHCHWLLQNLYCLHSEVPELVSMEAAAGVESAVRVGRPPPVPLPLGDGGKARGQ